MAAGEVSRAARRVGVTAALVTALSVVVAIPLLVPARSGPFCLEDCVSYPYADIARFWPGDYLWMWPAAIAPLALMVLGAAMIELAGPGRRVFAIAGFGFATAAAATLGIAYLSQIEVVQPSLLAGETDGIALLTQYNDHGLFIALEEFGYLMLAPAIAGIAMAPAPIGRAAALARWAGWINLAAVLGSFVFITVTMGVARSYRFEVVSIVTDWLALVVVGGALAWGLSRSRSRP